MEKLRRVGSAVVMACGMAGVSADPPTEPCVGAGPCDLPEYEVEYLGEEEFWYPPGLDVTFRVDRRPQCFVSLWALGESYDHNPLGLQPSWWSAPGLPRGYDCPIDEDENGRPDQFDWLIAQLDHAYSGGYRRITLRMPYGSVFGEAGLPQNVPAGHWWPMPEWRRYWFERATEDVNEPGGLAWWIAEHRDCTDETNDIEIGIYVAFPQNDPCTICYESNGYTTVEISESLYRYPCAGVGETVIPQPTSEFGATRLRQNLQPWIDVGVKMVWLDASGESGREQFRQFAWSPDYRSQDVQLGGESFALDSVPMARNVMSGGFFEAAPFMILLPSAELNHNNGRTSLADATAHQWEAQPGWEAVVWPSAVPMFAGPNGDEIRPDWTPERRMKSMYDFYVARGFALINGQEFAERLFGFGRIQSRADFNGDGAVNTQDYFDFQVNWSISMDYAGRHPTDAKALTFYHGDFDNSGHVDTQDWFTFLTVFFGSEGEFNLGPMHWDPNSTWVPTDDEWRND